MITHNRMTLIPVIAALAASLALAPATSMARDKDHREYSGEVRDHAKRHSDDGVRVGKYREHRGKGHKYTRGHGHHHEKKHRKQGHHYGHRHGHDHHGHAHHRGYRDEKVYVIHGPSRHRHYHGNDSLRFMIGLHTGNFDLILRD